MEPREALGQPDVRTYLRALSRRRFTVALVALLALGAALAYSLVKTPVYTASAQVLIPEQSATSALEPAGTQQAPAAANLQRSLSDAQQFAQGDQTKDAAKASLGFQAKIAIGASSSADILSFTAKNTSKAEAAAIANAYAKSFINADRANLVSQYTGQVLALQTSITQLRKTANSPSAGSAQQSAAESSITSLTQSVQQLQAASELVTQSGPSVVNAATMPTTPSSPRTVRNGLLGLLIGLILGIGLALLRDRLDDKAKSMRDVEEDSSGCPVVGAIPMVDSWRKGANTHVALVEDPESPVSEAYRTLRTSVQFLGIDETQRVIGITSSLPNEGKSTVTANLAVSFGRAGQRVVIMSCDFRRPRVHQFFKLDNHVGATSVLLGEATLNEAIQAVEGEPNLRLLASGPVPPNPAEILSLDRVRQLINALANNADVVILDCPPVLPVTDTLLISRLCDTMLVLCGATTSKRSDLRRTYELLNQVQAPVRGTIVNRVPNRGPYASAYGYGYGYGYISEHTSGTAGDVSRPDAGDGVEEASAASRRALVDQLAASESAARRRSAGHEPFAADGLVTFDNGSVKSQTRNGNAK